MIRIRIKPYHGIGLSHFFLKKFCTLSVYPATRCVSAPAPPHRNSVLIRVTPGIAGTLSGVPNILFPSRIIVAASAGYHGHRADMHE